MNETQGSVVGGIGAVLLLIGFLMAAVGFGELADRRDERKVKWTITADSKNWTWETTWGKSPKLRPGFIQFGPSDKLITISGPYEASYEFTGKAPTP